MILHLALAMNGNPLELADRIKALGRVSHLETKTRKWVWEIVTCRRNFTSFPPWILEALGGNTISGDNNSSVTAAPLFDAKPAAV